MAQQMYNVPPTEVREEQLRALDRMENALRHLRAELEGEEHHTHPYWLAESARRQLEHITSNLKSFY